jgi:plasmid stabilization system protein ParE
MSYAVVWAPTAERQLAAAWTAAADRTAVTAASAWLDARLAADPLRFGTPIDSSIHRTGTFDCLAVEFEVIEDDKRVIVHGVFAVG